MDLPRLLEWCLSGMVVVMIAASALVGFISQHTPPTHPSCLCNLKQIGIALHSYHDQYGSFPPAVITDSQGRPMCSWRVLILPFMDQDNLYRQYDFSQPWDSQYNRALLKMIPEVYRCPNVDGAGVGKTPFVAVVGEEAAWNEHGVQSKDSFGDGLKDTVMVLELPDDAVPWTKPEDIAFPASGVVGAPSSPKGEHVVNALFANGAVYGLDQNLFLGSLRSVFTRSAGDVVDRQLLKKAQEHHHIQ